MWSRIASTIAGCADNAVRKACDIADRRVELNDALGDKSCAEAADLWQKRHTLAEECRLGREAAVRLYREMASLVDGVLQAERAAVDLLKT